MKNIQLQYELLSQQWNYAKNYPYKPEDFKPRSNKKVWWICSDCNQEWESVINNRIRAVDCPFCNGNKISKNNSLGSKSSELLEEWHPTKNGNLSPYDIGMRSGKNIWWRCSVCEYEWISTPLNRTQGGKISKCARCNSLGMMNPELLEEWHPTKNGNLSPYDISRGSGKKVWWKCKKCNKEWTSSVKGRTIDGYVCKFCNCLINQNTELSKEWHPTKNGKLTPYDVSRGSKKRVWWKCKICNNEWIASVLKRHNGFYQCQKCKSLGMLNPRLSSEWHPIKNGKLTPYDVSWGSNRNVWWKCKKCKREWIARVMSRVDGNQCSFCKKIHLKDGFICDSLTEAYFYLKYRQEGKIFLYNQRYKGLGYCRYDFYFPNENTYLEITGFNSSCKFWREYLRRIVSKKRYVENNLKAKFIFLQKQLTKDEKTLVIKQLK